VRAKTDSRRRAKELTGEMRQRSLQVRELNVLIDGQTLDLVEHGQVGSVDGVGSVTLARDHDVDGRFVLFHPSSLHR